MAILLAEFRIKLKQPKFFLWHGNSTCQIQISVSKHQVYKTVS